MTDVTDVTGSAVTSDRALAIGGGRVTAPLRPTVVTGVAEGTRLVDEEGFGPAVPVLAHRDVDEVGLAAFSEIQVRYRKR